MADIAIVATCVRIALINITVLAIAVPCSQVTKIAIIIFANNILLDTGIRFSTIGHESMKYQYP